MAASRRTAPYIEAAQQHEATPSDRSPRIEESRVASVGSRKVAGVISPMARPARRCAAMVASISASSAGVKATIQSDRVIMSAPTQAAAPPIGPVARCMAAFPYSRRGALDVYASLSSGIGLAGYAISSAPTGWPSLIRAGRQGRGSWCRPASQCGPMMAFAEGSPAPVASALAARRLCSPVPPEPQVSRTAPEAAVCRGEDGRVLRQDPVLALRRACPHHVPSTPVARPPSAPGQTVTKRSCSYSRTRPARDPSRVRLLSAGAFAGRADGLAAGQCADDAPARTGAPCHALDMDDPALTATRRRYASIKRKPAPDLE